MNFFDILLARKMGGGGGTSDYTQLSNKPQINGATLEGNKSSAELKLPYAETSYIELASGIREYLSTTVPTGDIPTGSVGMGFDEGVWTYKIGTKSKSPIVVPHKTTEIYDECTYTIKPSQCSMKAGKKYIYVYSEVEIHSGWTRIAYGNLYCNDGTITDVSELTLENKEINPSILQRENKTGTNLQDIGMGVIAVNYVTLTNGTDTVTRYTSQNIAGNYTDMFRDSSMPLYFYANGQPLINYTIYGNDGGVGDEVTDSESAHYGEYDIPVICGNATTHIYLTSPLGANDSIDYTTSQVAIPTVDELNSLICDTTVQPSKVSLTYTGWHSDLDEINSRLAAIEQAIANGGT